MQACGYADFSRGGGHGQTAARAASDPRAHVEHVHHRQHAAGLGVLLIACSGQRNGFSPTGLHSEWVTPTSFPVRAGRATPALEPSEPQWAWLGSSRASPRAPSTGRFGGRTLTTSDELAAPACSRARIPSAARRTPDETIEECQHVLHAAIRPEITSRKTLAAAPPEDVTIGIVPTAIGDVRLDRSTPCHTPPTTMCPCRRMAWAR
jgi:hypothetical protein